MSSKFLELVCAGRMSICRAKRALVSEGESSRRVQVRFFPMEEWSSAHLPNRLMQLVLVSGHLIQFHITSQRVSHHLRSKTSSLLDAYVCSGHFATQSLPVDEFPMNREPLPRRFQDGLEIGDPELDTVFVIW